MRGGRREGAGRKKKSEHHGTAIQQAEERIRDRLPELIDVHFELAKGISLIDWKQLGKVRKRLEEACGDPALFAEIVENMRKTYASAPDRQAGEYLINRVMGKPIERQQSLDEEGEPVKIREIILVKTRVEG